MHENYGKLVRHLSDEAAMHHLCISCTLIGKRFERFVCELITVGANLQWGIFIINQPINRSG